MWRSVPQMEAARTRTRTSSGAIVGMGTVSSCAPSCGRILRSAFIVAVGIRDPGQHAQSRASATSQTAMVTHVQDCGKPAQPRPGGNKNERRDIRFVTIGVGRAAQARRVARRRLLSFSQRLQEIRTGFEPAFWVANVSELFERLAYYGAFASLANYLHESLNFPVAQAGSLAGIFGGMVWFLAIFGGALADRMGFRRSLSLAYLILAAAYFLIGSIGASWLAPLRNAVPLGLFVGCILILPALGISLVKPSVVGTTARASKENVRSIGYSIYYTMVNIGGAAGPYAASLARRHLGAGKIFYIAALSVFAMFF